MRFDRCKSWGRAVVCVAPLVCVVMNLGCSATPVGMAMHLAGEAVNDVDAKERAKQYVGAPVSEADAKLGTPVDVLSDTHSTRMWRTYSVPMDPLKNSRYVIEVHNGKIIALYKVQRYSDPVAYAATLAVLKPKVMGKSPADCEANLDMGAPRLTVRSQNTGRLIQLYDARVVKELQSPHYCVLRFSPAKVCEQIDMVKAYSPDGGDPTTQ